MLLNSDYHVFGVAESRLGPCVDDNIIDVSGYSCIRQDRNTEGGVIILYVRSFLKAKVLAYSDTSAPGKQHKMEYLMCRVWDDHSPPVFVGIVYRPPDVALNSDPTLLANLRDLCSDFSHKVIMGDFNADLLVNNTASRYIKSLANELSLKIVNHGATHRPFSLPIPKTWLDLIFVDDNDEIINFNNTPPRFHTDHHLIDVEISLFIPKPPQNDFTYRNFKSITPEDINEFMLKCDWQSFQSPDFDLANGLDCLSKNLQLAMDELSPLKTIKSKRRKEPWIDENLQFLIHKRNATEKRYLRTKNKGLLNEITMLTQQIEAESTTARNKFLHDRLDDAITTGNDFWKELRHLGLLPHPKSEFHGFSPDDLNIHFSKVSLSDTENSQYIAEIIMSASDSGFKFREVTFNEVVFSCCTFQVTGHRYRWYTTQYNYEISSIYWSLSCSVI